MSDAPISRLTARARCGAAAGGARLHHYNNPNSTDNFVRHIRAVTDSMRDHNMGSAYWPTLGAQGTPADIAQIGNETTNGMLWPDGHMTTGTTWRSC